MTAVIENLKQKVKQDVDAQDGDYVLNASETDLVEHFVSKYQLDVPVLHEDGADGCRNAHEAVLNRGLLQERPVSGAGLVSQDAARRTRLLDLEGWHEDDAGAVADCRFLRFGRDAADVVCSQVEARRFRRDMI